MLEPPPIPPSRILDRLRAEYGLSASTVTFLPLGADSGTAVYRVETTALPYFLKLRKGSFDPITVEVPHLLKTQGGSAIRAATIAPLETRAGRLWGELEPYRMILYPFVEGQDGYQIPLSDSQWVAYGALLRDLHDMHVPAGLSARIPRETFSPRNRDQARAYLAQALTTRFADPVAARLAALMRDRRDTITHLLDRCEALGRELRDSMLKECGPRFVLCHADVHPGNLHLTAQGDLYLVDWDEVIFAPKERDLMSIGAGMGSDKGQGEALFYHGYCRGDGRDDGRGYSDSRGYSPAETQSTPPPGDGYAQDGIDPIALAYYRCERVIADIAAFCDQLLASNEGGADREQSFEYFASNFRPGSVIEVAFRTDRYLMR